MKWWRKNRRLIIFLAVEFFTIVGLWHVFGKLLILAFVIGVAYYIIKNYSTLKNTKAEDWLNPMKYASVGYAFFMQVLFPFHIVEQLITRIFDMQCRQCAREGTCFNCKCDASKMYVPWEWCSLDNWGAMIEDADEYYAMRKEFPVIITVRYPREENPNAGFYEFIGHKPDQLRSPEGLAPYEVRMNPLDEPMALWSLVYIDEVEFGGQNISELISRGMLRPQQL